MDEWTELVLRVRARRPECSDMTDVAVCMHDLENLEILQTLPHTEHTEREQQWLKDIPILVEYMQ